MKLNELSDNPGATKNRKRVGRGAGSGTGKTAGRGMKGQKSRSGVSIKGFEGGQMPLYRRLPKRGFTNIFRRHYVELSTGRLQTAIDAKKIDAKSQITGEALVEAGVLRRLKDGVRLLVKGELKTKVDIVVAGASKGAVTAVEDAGGKVTMLAPPKAETEDKKPKKTKKAKAADTDAGTEDDKTEDA
jgi:large subunit ribosomal protein L15